MDLMFYIVINLLDTQIPISYKKGRANFLKPVLYLYLSLRKEYQNTCEGCPSYINYRKKFFEIKLCDEKS